MRNVLKINQCKEKIFLVFGGEEHYPEKGAINLLACLSTREGAIAFANSMAGDYEINRDNPDIEVAYDWIQVYDLYNDSIIISGSSYPFTWNNLNRKSFPMDDDNDERL